MKFKIFNVLLLLALLIEALVAASKEITKLDSSSNNIMNTNDYFSGGSGVAVFNFGLDRIGVYLMLHILGHQEFRYLSPIGRNEDTNTLNRNIKYGILGDDAVFRVYNTDDKEIYKLGEESSVRGQSTMTFEFTDAYRNDDEYTVLNFPLTYGIVITNASGEKFYYPPRKTDTTEPVPSVHPMQWIKWDGSVPEDAVSIKNSNGKKFIVGRTDYDEGIHCGYVDVDSKQLIISYGGSELIYDDNFEILTGSSYRFEWKKIDMDNKSEYADQIVIGGNENDGVKLGVAKCKYNDNYYFGKVNLDQLQYCNFGINHKEVECLDFEVLIYSDEPVEPEPLPSTVSEGWIKWNGSVPENAVSIKNSNGKKFIVGRTSYNEGIHCGYVDVDSKQLIISYGGKELIYDDNFEILTGFSNRFEWKKININNKSAYADQIVIGGNESNGVKLGVAKCKYNDNYYFGKVNLNLLHHGNFGINHKEIDCTNFEVLIYYDEPEDDEWKRWNGTLPEDAVSLKNSDGKTLAVGRTKYSRGIHCGYIDVDSKQLTISYDGKELIFDENFEILTDAYHRFEWKKINMENKSKYANRIVIGGHESYGVELGVAKCKYKNKYYFGKVNLDYLLFGNFGINHEEIECPDFEVLIYSR